MIKKRGVLFITAITLLLLVVICPGRLQAENGISRTDEPIVVLRKGPYLIYPDDNTEMKVLWQLWETAVCTLEWGFDNTTFPFSVETNESGGGEHQHQHSHIITSLMPGTKYYYRVSVKGQDDYYTGSFWAAPTASATELKFMAYGDSRSYPAIHNTVAGAMVSTYDADSDFQTFILSTGDLVGDGGSETDWDYHLLGSNQPSIQEMLANVPFHSCMGNHELPGDLFEKYLPYPFEAPRYWSYDYGPAHFVVVDQYTDYSPGSAQHSWIEDDLASTTKAWKFICLHEPGWSAGGHPNNPNVQDYIQPLCERYGVSMVFAGHNHYYARAVINGVHHVTTGGGGAPLYVPDPGAPHVVATSMSYHFCTVEIDGDSLTFTAVQPDDTVIDTFSILVSAGAIWKYLDDGTDQGTAWREILFDDSGWASGRAQLGYGDGDEATVIEYGPDPNNKYPCYYFRHSFNIADPSAYESLRLKIIRDDGAVVYLNGVEVFRTNMPAGPITYDTWASSAVGGDAESAWYETNVDASHLVSGTNVIAVEVHQHSPTSSDVSFDLQLLAQAEPLPDIKANGSDGPVFVTPLDPVELTISLDPGTMAGVLCDWWIVIFIPPDTVFPILLGQIPLFDLPEIPLFNVPLPIGIYGFLFILDDVPDGSFGITWYDYVIVACLPQGVEMEIPSDFEALLKERMEDLIEQ